MTNLHDRVFPGESPEYRQARNTLLAAELELDEKIGAVNALRSSLPPGGLVPTDYEFSAMAGGQPTSVKLSSLFAPGKNSLIVYSFMFSPQMAEACPACTSLIDCLNGAMDHVGDRINFVVVGKSPIERLDALVKARGWHRINMVSSHTNTYNADYFGETDKGIQLATANVFTKSDDAVRHFTASEMLFVNRPGHPRHVDRLWPVWNIFDLVPEGRGENWFPKLDYGR
ncbi:MAG: DUF899 family protein [Alphaproteobacteria bacterium]